MSSTGSEVTLLDLGYIESGNPRVHSGYGASRLPIQPSASAGIAGSQFDKIFQAQLGRAAASNSLGLFKTREHYYAAVPYELRRLDRAGREQYIKPYDKPWNEETKAQYSRHWNLVKHEYKEPEVIRNPTNWEQLVSYGIILPYSRNIGPGNTIQEATNNADLIAQGHDLHYKQSKSDQDIFNADREALGQFIVEATNPQDPISQVQAAIGAVGLGIKHGAELALGRPIYGKYVSTLS